MHILWFKYIEINRFKYIINNKNYKTYRLIFILCINFELYKISFILYLYEIKIYK